jgi:hypothetical protein
MTMAFLLEIERPDEWDVVVEVPPGSLLRRASTFKPGRRFDRIRASTIMATELNWLVYVGYIGCLTPFRLCARLFVEIVSLTFFVMTTC